MQRPAGPDPGQAHEDFGDGDIPAGSPFGSGSPGQILERLFHGDPIELRARCVDRLKRQAYLFDPDRLYLRALARTAHAAPRYNGTPAIDVWLAERISVSLRELIEEDREAERRGASLDEIDSVSPLLEAWGVDRNLVRRAALAFNSQSYAVRRAFYALAIERKTFPQLVDEGNGSPEQVRKLARRAIHALGLPDPDGPAPSKGGAFDA